MKRKCIVYGAGRIGRESVKNLLDMKQEIEVIFDRNPEKEGEYMGIPVCVLKDFTMLKELNKNSEHTAGEYNVIIGIANPPENEIIFQQFKKMGFDNVFKYSTGDYIEQICEGHSINKEKCIRCVWCESCRLFKNWCIERSLQDTNSADNKIIDVLSIAATNRCTLNCRACAQCTAEIRERKRFLELSVKSLEHYMNKMFESVSYIHQVALTGGEALLCKELPEILRYLSSSARIGYVKLLTTATVAFSEELMEVLESNDILVCIDDYGDKLSPFFQEKVRRNKQRIDEIPEIACVVIENSHGTWYDLGDFHKRREEGIRNNKECMFRRCLFLSAGGILSWCSRNVSCIECDLTPDFPSDYCDLNKTNSIDEICSVLSLSYIHACEYCNGTGGDNMIRSGVQQT